MNKPLSVAEVDLQFTQTFPTLTKKAKLTRLASVVRAATGNLYIFDSIEDRDPADLNQLSHPHSAFALAAADSVLKDAGLKSGTVGAAKTFFELSTDELHAFSCNCGGAVTNNEMARRIENIATTA
jgi:hypothetical protein